MEEIAPNVYVESDYAGVTVGAIVTGKGVVCIDSPMLPADARDWRSRIASLTREPVRYVIYTDAHRDRILGGQYMGGVVVTHNIAAEALKGYGDTFRQQVADFMSRRAPDAALEIVTALHVVLPQITFSKRLALYCGSASIVLQHVGGATSCSLWVLLPKQGVLFAGDTVTLNRHPSLVEADIDGWIDLLGQLSGAKSLASIIVPGRGGPVSHARDLKKLSAYLRTVRTRTRAVVRAGRPRADIATLVQDFLPRFHVSNDERDHIQRRIKAGLEHAYDVYSQKRTK
jgi:glyoxylase-like metal-dependent hydrolase (beta-lactamase superfamily II)